MPNHQDPKALRAAAERLRTMVPTEHDLRQGAALLSAVADDLDPPPPVRAAAGEEHAS